MSDNKQPCCEEDVPADGTVGFTWRACGKPAKYSVNFFELPSAAQKFCGIHANAARRRGAKVREL